MTPYRSIYCVRGVISTAIAIGGWSRGRERDRKREKFIIVAHNLMGHSSYYYILLLLLLPSSTGLKASMPNPRQGFALGFPGRGGAATLDLGCGGGWVVFLSMELHILACTTTSSYSLSIWNFDENLLIYMFLEICVRVEFQLRVWERMAQECFLGKGVRVCHIDDVD
jgi:hypothetical protein